MESKTRPKGYYAPSGSNVALVVAVLAWYLAGGFHAIQTDTGPALALT